MGRGGENPVDAAYAPMLGNTSQSLTCGSGSWYKVRIVSNASHAGPNTVDGNLFFPWHVGLSPCEEQANGSAITLA